MTSICPVGAPAMRTLSCTHPSSHSPALQLQRGLTQRWAGAALRSQRDVTPQAPHQQHSPSMDPAQITAGNVWSWILEPWERLCLRELDGVCCTLDSGSWQGEFVSLGWLLQKQQPKGRQQEQASEPGTPGL